MNYSRRMKLVPDNEESDKNENVSKPKRIERDMDKIHKLIKIVLKLALNKSYDENFNIRDESGKPLSDTDIAELLNQILSPQKIIHGENEFIRLLYQSGVNPDWIINQNIRAKLMSFNYNYYRRKPRNQSPPPSPPKSRSNSPSNSMSISSPFPTRENSPSNSMMISSPSPTRENSPVRIRDRSVSRTPPGSPPVPHQTEVKRVDSPSRTPPGSPPVQTAVRRIDSIKRPILVPQRDNTKYHSSERRNLKTNGSQPISQQTEVKRIDSPEPPILVPHSDNTKYYSSEKRNLKRNLFSNEMDRKNDEEFINKNVLGPTKSKNQKQVHAWEVPLPDSDDELL